MKGSELNMEYKEIWSYLVSCLSLLWNWIPHTCENWTTLFAMLTVIVTFFFITLPRAIVLRRKIKYCDKKNNEKNIEDNLRTL